MAGAYTVFRTTEGASPRNTPDSGSDKDIRSRQIDELVRLSEDARRDVYGTGADNETRDFYNLRTRSRKSPTYKPHIAAPQLQTLLLSDAADLTDGSIRVYVTHKRSGRDAKREKAFQAHWRQEKWSLQLLQAQVYSQFSGTSWLHGYYDPLADDGDGKACLRALEQRRVYADPSSPWPEDWTYQIIEQDLYLDEIYRRWPDYAPMLKPRTSRAETLAGPPAGGIEMPPGPMSVTVRGLPGGEQYTTDGIVRVRHLFARDSTLREPTDAERKAFADHGLPSPKYLPKYPFGRYIVDAEGTILVDGESWLPLDKYWPAVPVWSLPPWDSPWCPSPVKLSRLLQDAAERLMTMSYENAYRLNNGILLLPEESGLTADGVGGLPGEIMTLAPNSQREPKFLYPPPMPPQMIQLPLSYLQLQRELQGFPQARQGNPGQGNVSADLFESAVNQSQSITRLKARLFSYSVEKAAQLMFYCMTKFYRTKRVFWLAGPSPDQSADADEQGDDADAAA